jgi:ankyrin repeat protein
MSGDRDVVLSLLDRGTDQNADPGAPRGWSPLMTAAFYGHPDIAKLLVERGAKLDTVEIDRWWTALDLALDGGHTEIAAYLASVGGKRGGPRRDV